MDLRASRYREPPVALAADARGRTPATTPLRARPESTGSFRHVVAQGERLDQLAHHYYEEPTSWWQICDANPQFLSPLALLGQESVSTVRLPIRSDSEATFDWVAMRGEFATDPALKGVEDVAIDEEVHYATVVRTVTVAGLGSRDVQVVEQRIHRSLIVRFNGTGTSIDSLLRAVRTMGLAVDPPVDRGQLGREIVIPPTGSGWVRP